MPPYRPSILYIFPWNKTSVHGQHVLFVGIETNCYYFYFLELFLPSLLTPFATPLLSSIAKSLPLLTAHPPAKLQPSGLRCKVCRVEI